MIAMTLAAVPVVRYRQAGDMFVALVARIDAADWAKPGLGSWTVRSLVGHANRQFVLVANYALADAALVRRPGDYYRLVRGPLPPTRVARRGVDDGAGLGDNPLAAVIAARHAAYTALREVASVDDLVVQSVVGGVSLPVLLQTRTFELVVHCLDIARAIDDSLTIPEPLLADALAVAADIAVCAGRGEEILRRLCGRDEPGEAAGLTP